MTNYNSGRVVVITGAGNGIGRAHALAFAASGAKVVVNDLGGDKHGSGGDLSAAAQVVAEIEAVGGTAIADGEDVSDFAAAKRLIDHAIDAFGALDVLVNNAGILRDRMLVNTSEDEWDSVIRVHLKGAFATARHAAAYWRDEAREGRQRVARIINTTSPSGLFGNVGQANYAAAKAGIAALTIVSSVELLRYGITVNAIAPTAFTRMTNDLPGLADVMNASNSAPEAISPLVVWLGSERSKSITGRVFGIWAGKLTVNEGWVAGPVAERENFWSIDEIDATLPDLLTKAAPNADMYGQRTSLVTE